MKDKEQTLAELKELRAKLDQSIKKMSDEGGENLFRTAQRMNLKGRTKNFITYKLAAGQFPYLDVVYISKETFREPGQDKHDVEPPQQIDVLVKEIKEEDEV